MVGVVNHSRQQALLGRVCVFEEQLQSREQPDQGDGGNLNRSSPILFALGGNEGMLSCYLECQVKSVDSSFQFHGLCCIGLYEFESGDAQQSTLADDVHNVLRSSNT